MASTPLSGRQRDALMQHLDSLFSLAQVVTPSAEEAVQLVEATYRRAFNAPAEAPAEADSATTGDSIDLETGEQVRVWLFRLMMQTRTDLASGPGQTSHTPTELADLRRRLAEEFIDRAMPAAFASLPSDLRLLLMLCDVQRMACEDAGRVLASNPASACDQLEKARVALHHALYANANDAERHLLDTALPPNWKRAALQRMAESQLVAVPPTLRPSVVSIFKNVSQPGSAADRTPVPTPETKAKSSGLAGAAKKLAAVLGLIVVAGLLGYGFTYLTRHEPDVNLISLSAGQAGDVEANVQTTSAEQAERYISDRLGMRVTLPTIDGAALQGVSVRSLVDEVEVPVVLFQDASTGEPITIYVYSYAFLDRHRENLVLERDILRQIEAEGNFDLHDLGQEKALVWRNRDDIFIAITSGDAEELRGRITFPS